MRGDWWSRPDFGGPQKKKMFVFVFAGSGSRSFVRFESGLKAFEGVLNAFRLRFKGVLKAFRQRFEGVLNAF